MDNLITIVSSGVVSVASSGALIWLSKSWISERIKGAIQHEYDQKLETHKAQLQSRNEIEIAKLRAELEIAAAERNTRFSRVFEKTAETIATTYRDLVALRNAVNRYLALLGFVQDADEVTRTFVDIDAVRQDFAKNFDTNRIYVPKETALKIASFSETLMKMTHAFHKMMALEKNETHKHLVGATQFNDYMQLSEKVPELLTLLEDDFQKILGFPIEEKPTTKP
jgi:hypothetical protein